MRTYQLGFIGAGAMAQAIISGIIKADIFKGSEILVSNRSQEKLDALEESYGITKAKDNRQIIEQCQTIVLAIKPQQLTTLQIQAEDGCQADQLLISILAGIDLASLEETFGLCPIVRVMPNTPAQIGCGLSAISANSLTEKKHLDVTEQIFASVGQTIIVPEEQMDAIGAISGSGPAYVYQFIEAMADAGVMTGLPRALAYSLAAQTMVGAGQMVLTTNLHPAVLKDQVTSPGGTTIRALEVLEQHGVRGAIIEAIEQAYLHSKRLGGKE